MIIFILTATLTPPEIFIGKKAPQSIMLLGTKEKFHAQTSVLWRRHHSSPCNRTKSCIGLVGRCGARLYSTTRKYQETDEESCPDGKEVKKQRITAKAQFGMARIGMVVMPPSLLAAVNETVQQLPSRQVKADIKWLRENDSSVKNAHRKSHDTVNFIPTYGVRESIAYTATRFIPTFSATTAVLSQVAKRIPSYAPASVLDFASGPGSALLAAKEIWPESIDPAQVTIIDQSESMLAVCRKLLSHRPDWNKQATSFLTASSPTSSTAKKYDLVMACFALGELVHDSIRSQAVASLWDQTSDILLLIDRGNPEGSHRIARAREQILNQIGSDCHIVAPCSHELECPMLSKGKSSLWCHFSQRFQKDKNMMLLQGSKSNLEDVKYSYLVVRRGRRPLSATHTPSSTSSAVNGVKSSEDEIEVDSAVIAEAYSWPRIIAAPIKKGGHILLDQCTAEGQLQRVIVSKSHGSELYKDARKSHWGDLWPHEPQGAVVPLGSKVSDSED